jgi:hypothetical protein
MLSGKKQVDCQQYDHVWYVTHTCPGMKTGCEHHPELAASKKTCNLCYPPHTDLDLFYKEYVRELTSEPRISKLKQIVERSEAGEWFQLIFYEDDPNDGERPYMYKILKQLTNDVYIE